MGINKQLDSINKARALAKSVEQDRTSAHGSGGRNCVGGAGEGGAAETWGAACSGVAGTGLRNAAAGCGGGTEIL